jgi:hypothetical protein
MPRRRKQLCHVMPSRMSAGSAWRAVAGRLFPGYGGEVGTTNSLSGPIKSMSYRIARWSNTRLS